MTRRRLALIGHTFGRLTVIGEAPSRIGRGQMRRYVAVRCSCGTEKEIMVATLVLTRSCGCSRKGRVSANYKHGGTKTSTGYTPEYTCWTSMRDRCRNPKNKAYRLYGGRGITVCDRWNDFRCFALDMGPRPQNTSLDRIDPEKGYFPENCRWASARVQSLNRRNMRGRPVPPEHKIDCQDGKATIGAHKMRGVFGKLLEMLADGIEVTITKNGTPVAILAPHPDRLQSSGASQREAA